MGFVMVVMAATGIWILCFITVSVGTLVANPMLIGARMRTAARRIFVLRQLRRIGDKRTAATEPDGQTPPDRPSASRACRQLSQTTLATSWTAARKLRAVFS